MSNISNITMDFSELLVHHTTPSNLNMLAKESAKEGSVPLTPIGAGTKIIA